MPSKKISAASLERIEDIATSYAAFAASRRTVEYEIRREIQARLDAQEAIVAAKVLSAMLVEDISNAALMRAIGKQNPDRWKAWLAKWEPLVTPSAIESAEDTAPDEVIDYEIPYGDSQRKVPGLDRYFGDKPTLRIFKLRTIRYPGGPKEKLPGTDRVIWDTEAPDFDSPDFGFNISNPGWGNAPNIGFGPDRDEVLSAILAWIEKNPEAPE